MPSSDFYVNINNFLLDQFHSFEYKNVNSILVKKIVEISIGNLDKEVFIHIQKEHFEIVVVRNQQLLLFNSFEYSTPEDFIYYILFTFRQKVPIYEGVFPPDQSAVCKLLLPRVRYTFCQSWRCWVNTAWEKGI